MAFYTLRLRNDDVVEMIDQRKLPLEISYVELKNYGDVYDAIKGMIVRGAPAIGVAAAFGLYLAAKSLSESATRYEAFKDKFFKICDFMFSARPTAVNLGWAIERIKSLVIKDKGKTVTSIVQDIKAESLKIYDEDIEINKNMGHYGAELLKDGYTVLTHCNAGALATAGYGTALGVIRAAVENNKKISVISDETRPFLQGARLTAWELMEDNIPVTLIADNSAGLLMRKGKINAVIVGADRIASNGDVANKIGTYQVAVLAHENNIPFYVAAPLSTIDLTLESGDEIPIEERGIDEVVNVFGTRIAPNGVKALNYAFDITPNKYVKAIITEKGVLYPPYKKSIAEAFGK
ncbi:MAG: S-methyl-5-thioribose-1-phosphate isomerase [Candidatus Acidulodesulfobacterium ferriphilum]|uniref:Methylthioribose-1-phosphate isomerase n=1 Tax=Candidatus Acidulodesulfobacterium ferriphilum TaxID=2597223 RepID=A0A519BB77_9DELT|nr:MAG: S-methyl-5-thioribose-1-phosphate isomerase [Candidatus Acidulodesulfobacterium ferriphilum]